MVVLTACSTKDDLEEDMTLLDQSWEEIVAKADSSTVTMYMWGGSESINRYMDDYVAPAMQERYGVTFKRVPVSDTKDVLTQLLAEKKAGATGNADIIWINGENFKSTKEEGLLWQPFADKIPNVNRYMDLDSKALFTDFGMDTEGLEVPWGKAQFVFIYDSEKVTSPPKSMEELKQWVMDNPGRFTYPAPPDFHGSAFIRHVLYETTGGYENYDVALNEDALKDDVQPMWDYLNEIEPYLWREGKTYPESASKLDTLFAGGEVWMTMAYDPAKASNEVMNGNFPTTTKTFVLEQGTLTNSHYLSIPFNAPNKAAAMVAINFLVSPEAQIRKSDPTYWGEGMVLDASLLEADDVQRIMEIEQARGDITLSEEELSSHQVPEIRAEYVPYLEKEWFEHVAKN